MGSDDWKSMTRVLIGNKPKRRVVLARMGEQAGFDVLPMKLDKDSIASPAVDVIIPTGRAEYDLLRPKPMAMARSLVPKVGHVMLADHKALFNQWLFDNGFADCVPRIFHRTEPLIFPLIHKACIDANGENSHLILSEEDLARHDTDAELPGGTFLQEYVVGAAEHAAHVIAIEGKVVYAATVTSLHRPSHFVKGQRETPIRWVVRNDYAPPEVFDILARLSYTGAACFDYKIDGGQMKLFEMNPRIGGSFWNLDADYLLAYAKAVGLLGVPSDQP